ncbi:unnamed protein product [Prunus armeniaca]|uniref:RNase H type-1 domain-containing protein n=1 Tax=Prunus armeniaca TaxID=36596 RepID=A0A6J5UUI3_PRUAR|nr:unnamed protein product [Prunus armeniaca]
MKLMMVMMAMTLLTTSHGIGIHINTSVVTRGYSASRCNGLTDTACRIAHSELDLTLEFMLDSEFSIRILQSHYYNQNNGERLRPATELVTKFPATVGNKNQNPTPEHCKEEPTNKACWKHF